MFYVSVFDECQHYLFCKWLTGLLLCNQVSQAMSTNYLKVQLSSTIKEAVQCMEDGQQTCVLVVDPGEHLEGILTYGDIKRAMSRNYDEVADGGVSSTPDVCQMCD